MSGAAAATSALDATAALVLADVRAAVNQARDAQALFRATEDLVEKMGAVAVVILGCEAMEDAAKQAGAALRLALARSMAETGATTIRTPGDHHTVSLRNASRRVVVTDESAIPSELMTTPAPKPDLTEIGRRLRAKEPVPGAELSNGGDPTIAIKGRDQ